MPLCPSPPALGEGKIPGVKVVYCSSGNPAVNPEALEAVILFLPHPTCLCNYSEAAKFPATFRQRKIADDDKTQLPA
jgi:hypothetical protein